MQVENENVFYFVQKWDFSPLAMEQMTRKSVEFHARPSFDFK